jgi:hypothetical protein
MSETPKSAFPLSLKRLELACTHTRNLFFSVDPERVMGSARWLFTRENCTAECRLRVATVPDGLLVALGPDSNCIHCLTGYSADLFAQHVWSELSKDRQLFIKGLLKNVGLNICIET